MVNVADQLDGERRVYWCLMDVTAEKKAEESRDKVQKLELKKYEAQLKMLTSMNDDFVAYYHLNITKDQCTNIQIRDAAHVDLNKLVESGTANGLFAATAKTIPDPDIAAKVLDTFHCSHLLKKFEQGEMKVSLEYPCHSVLGGIRWILGIVNMVQNPETGDIEGVTYAVDIDNQKKIELVTGKIAEQEFEYVGLLYLKSEEIELVQKKAHIIYPELREKVPFSMRRQFVQNNFADVQEVDSYIQNTDLSLIKAELAKKGNYTVSYLQTDKEGMRRCQQVRFSWLDEPHQIALLLQTDVTASYEHEEGQIIAIQNALVEAEKASSAKTDFVSRISHDIRTPIGAIKNITAFAFEDINDPEKLKDDLRKIQVSNEFLLSLVNDVLDISKIDSGKIELHMEPYSYGDFCSSIQNMFEPLCEKKKIHFVLGTPPTVSAISVDRIRFNQMAMNLVANAIKYTPEGGKVGVTLSVESGQDGMCNCTFTVEDTGIGMSQEFQKKMFEPFTQEDDNPGREPIMQGTGLGLSLVKKIIDLVGGTITTESELGRGTRISAAFSAMSAEATGRAVGDENAKSGKKRCQLPGKVLLVEDNIINTNIEQRILQAIGVEVVHAENGKRAVERFAESSPGEYSAILMDIQMPIMNGYEATKAIRSMNRFDAQTIPIIAMTADAFLAAIEHSKAVGMTDYVTKPIEPDKIYHVLAKYGNC